MWNPFKNFTSILFVRDVDILENQDIRQALPNISDWPTFPQVFLNGELIGGCDIVTEMHAAGELQSAIDELK